MTSDQAVTVAYVDATLGDDSAAVQDAAGNDAELHHRRSTTPCPSSVPADWGLIPSGLGAGAEFRS